jgi:hypothetical protein
VCGTPRRSATRSERVAIGRDDARGDRLLVAEPGERPDDVVRLAPDDAEVAVAEGLDELREEGPLLLEQLRRRLARALVARVQLEALGGLFVPADDHAGGLVVLQQLHQHAGEAEQGAGRKAVARREVLRQCVVRAVRQRVAVDEEEPALTGGRVVEIELGGLLHHGCSLAVTACALPCVAWRPTTPPRTA